MKTYMQKGTKLVAKATKAVKGFKMPMAKKAMPKGMPKMKKAVK